MEYILAWEKAYKTNCTQLLGGKGFNLSLLDHLGFQVPKGYVLTTAAYQQFIKDNNLIELINKVNSLTLTDIDSKNNQDLIKEIERKILEGEFSNSIVREINSISLRSSLAVRSSASLEDSEKHSFAGIHESYLNIRQREDLVTSIKKCYASMWSLRAVTYRKKFGISDRKILMAVVVMEMVDSKSSGVAFTCDPRTGNNNSLIIHANFGLGESLVSGQVDPDEYFVSYFSLEPEISQKKIGTKELIYENNTDTKGGIKRMHTAHLSNKQALSDEQIIELSKEVLRVYSSIGNLEKHQDIEWVFDGETFFIVQARLITMVESLPSIPELEHESVIWSNANFKDVMPHVQSMLSWSIIHKALDHMITTPLRESKYDFPNGTRHTRLYKGRAYMNLTALQWEMYDAFGISPQKFNEGLGGHQPEIKAHLNTKPTIFKRVIRTKRKIGLAVKMLKDLSAADQQFNRTQKDIRKVLSKDLTLCSELELTQLFKETYRKLYDYVPKAQMLNSLAGLFYITSLSRLESKYSDQSQKVLNSLIQGKGNITSAEQGYRLYHLAEIVKGDQFAQEFFKTNLVGWENISNQSQFKKEFSNYLEEFGHRGSYELDISNARWTEDPLYLLNIIKDLSLIKKPSKKSGTEIESLKKDFSFLSYKYISFLLKKTIKSSEYREMAKSVLAYQLYALRKISLEIGNRLERSGVIGRCDDIFHLTWYEIDVLINKRNEVPVLISLIKERKKRNEEMAAINPPDCIVDDTPLKIEKKTLNNSKSFLLGIGVSSGNTTGVVRKLNHPSEGNTLQPGDVLLASSTDPSWTPLFLKVSGIILETGGYLSHGAIVAREFGVPAVVNVQGLQDLIKEGQKVTVNGDEGKVYLH